MAVSVCPSVTCKVLFLHQKQCLYFLMPSMSRVNFGTDFSPHTYFSTTPIDMVFLCYADDAQLYVNVLMLDVKRKIPHLNIKLNKRISEILTLCCIELSCLCILLQLFLTILILPYYQWIHCSLFCCLVYNTLFLELETIETIFPTVCKEISNLKIFLKHF